MAVLIAGRGVYGPQMRGGAGREGGHGPETRGHRARDEMALIRGARAEGGAPWREEEGLGRRRVIKTR